MLMGIVTKNAIMLVDFAVEEVARGVPRFDAVIDAGRKRARPIVMTTLAMVAGMIPSAMAIGDGGEFRAPMAIAVIGGLLVSTVLSLVFVPSFFTVMDDVGRFVWWIFGRFIGPTDEPPEPRRSNRSRPPRPGRVGLSRTHNCHPRTWPEETPWRLAEMTGRKKEAGASMRMRPRQTG